MYDTIIIGAGMSGLAAGIRLAHFEQRVCILERHSTIGGLNSFYRLNGRNFDVGLHALTNYVPPGTKVGPLSRLLRALRIGWDQLPLCQQVGSAIAFPGVRLRFNNDFEFLLSEVHRAFPGEEDGLRRLAAALAPYEEYGQARHSGSARAVLESHVREPLLREMLLCPLAFYGSPREHDPNFDEFSILFRSIFLEGFARPQAGVRELLKLIVRKYKEVGGELRLRCGVRRLIVSGDCVQEVELDDGTRLAARRVLSSAGLRETFQLCEPQPKDLPAPGALSFVEALSVVDREPAELGLGESIVFFNDAPQFEYRRPQDLVDVRSGVICVPNNFQHEKRLADGMVRISCLANYDGWNALAGPDYGVAKDRWYARMVASAERFVPPFRQAVVARDMFTPLTIRRFTGHDQGAVYGCGQKRHDGTTHLRNLFVCGNDQGLVGIVGTLLSGITVATNHLLQR